MALLYTLLTLLIFSILVVIHEAGHFAVAKKSGILVEEFAVGMGPVVYSKRKGDTLYSLRALPLGGFCRMLGEDESVNDDRAFEKKSVLSKIAVVFAGPLMNFVFAFIAVFFLVSTSASQAFPVVDGFADIGNAKNAGVEIGDRITEVNGEKINSYQEMTIAFKEAGEKILNIKIDRNGEKISFDIQPVYDEANKKYIIGIRPLVKTGILAQSVEGYERAALSETVYESYRTLIYYVESVVKGFVRLFTMRISPEEVSGPIGIVQVVGDTVETGIQYSIIATIKSLVALSALLSVNLGVINLFPIPSMDGGRLVFLFVEAVRGKPMNKEKEGLVHYLGFMLLLVFMFFVASNDIIQLIKGR